MIGQRKNLEYIDNLKTIPHFIVFVGSKGSGKTTLAKYISQKLGATFSICGIKVDEVREVIDTAYYSRDKILYCVRNADTMRNEAKNAMLKITEEPPENAWFVLTVEDDSSLLDTIKSRAFVINIEPYTQQDIIDYYTQNYDGNPKYIDIASTPYELDMMMKYGDEFINYVELVLDNIAYVEPANAFKSSDKLALKKEEGFDLNLFFKVFCKICLDRVKTDTTKYSEGILATVNYIGKCNKLGVNKQQLYDSWVFDIRRAWHDYT